LLSPCSRVSFFNIFQKKIWQITFPKEEKLAEFVSPRKQNSKISAVFFVENATRFVGKKYISACMHIDMQ